MYVLSFLSSYLSHVYFLCTQGCLTLLMISWLLIKKEEEGIGYGLAIKEVYQRLKTKVKDYQKYDKQMK